jgi:uncharacterized protein with NRDE domain
VCTVLLRFAPGDPWPLRLGAVRDEFADRAWDPPAAHWGDRLLGGRDRVAGGTWLAVDPDRPAVAAVLNGPRLPVPDDGVRPSRGGLPLAALRGGYAHDDRYDGYHLVLGTTTGVTVWSWDGDELVIRELPPGDHLIVNQGLGGTSLLSTVDDWPSWRRVLAGNGLLVDREHEGRRYASTSEALVGLGAGVWYEFNPVPTDPAAWYPVLTNR